MDSVSRLDQVMQLIGRQLSERAAHLDSGAPPLPPTRGARTRRAGRPGLEVLRKRVQERLRQIDPDDPKRIDKLHRAFLESVLAWQFGKELLLEPGLEDAVAGVSEALRAQPDVESQFRRLLLELAAPRG